MKRHGQVGMRYTVAWGLDGMMYGISWLCDELWEWGEDKLRRRDGMGWDGK